VHSSAAVALLTPMTLAQARAIGAAYDLDVVAVQALTAGSVNSNFRLEVASGERFFLRVYEEQALSGAASELRMIRELSALGVPTPAPRERRAGGYVSEHAGKPVGIHPWVDGDSLCLARVTPEIAAALGGALARVHACTRALTGFPDGRFGLPALFARLDVVDRTDSRFASHTRAIRERLAHYAESAGTTLPTGVIHGDLFRDNVLWRGGELVALLDFESASAGVFVYDIMVCVHAWCYGDAFDLGLIRALLSGYEKVRPLSADELGALPAQGALAALRFATTRLTDFSLRTPPGQTPARDFQRFIARLQALEANVLDPIIERRMP
jgi:homoserine kinase type II